MKVLFLDIDGVANCATTSQRHRGFIGIDPYMALLVNRIIEATGCKVVLSSTWRMWEDSIKEVKEQVCDIMDTTPQISGATRGEEIREWLNMQAVKSNFFVKRYAILDDDSGMLPEQIPNFFKTSWSTGLTQEIADKVIEHLNKECPFHDQDGLDVCNCEL